MASQAVKRFCIGISGMAAAGCTVYTPLQPSLPCISDGGQVEVRGSIQPATFRPEVSVAYSPIKHVLVTGTGSWRGQLSVPDTALFRVKQAEIGLGTYWPVSKTWTISILGGYGWGNSARRINDGGIISYSTDYFAGYQTQFGQLGLVYNAESRLAIGVGNRLTHVQFNELRTSELALPRNGQWRYEPSGFVRKVVGQSSAGNQWQVELSGALSLSQPGRAGVKTPYDPVQARTDMNRGSAWLFGVGVTYQVGRTRSKPSVSL